MAANMKFRIYILSAGDTRHGVPFVSATWQVPPPGTFRPGWSGVALTNLRNLMVEYRDAPHISARCSARRSRAVASCARSRRGRPPHGRCQRHARPVLAARRARSPNSQSRVHALTVFSPLSPRVCGQGAARPRPLNTGAGLLLISSPVRSRSTASSRGAPAPGYEWTHQPRRRRLNLPNACSNVVLPRKRRARP